MPQPCAHTGTGAQLQPSSHSSAGGAGMAGGRDETRSGGSREGGGREPSVPAGVRPALLPARTQGTSGPLSTQARRGLLACPIGGSWPDGPAAGARRASCGEARASGGAGGSLRQPALESRAGQPHRPPSPAERRGATVRVRVSLALARSALLRVLPCQAALGWRRAPCPRQCRRERRKSQRGGLQNPDWNPPREGTEQQLVPD